MTRDPSCLQGLVQLSLITENLTARLLDALTTADMLTAVEDMSHIHEVLNLHKVACPTSLTGLRFNTHLRHQDGALGANASDRAGMADARHCG